MFADLLSQSGLSLERLHSFCLVAEVGGVTRAAKGDPAKQSLYSRQIKELEEFFGAELIRRKGRGIVLTSAGQRLHGIAREQFAALSDFKSECRGQPLEIVIGAGESIIQWLLLPRLAAIEKQLKNARHKFLNLTNAEIVRRLNDGLLDFGIVRKGEVTKPLRSTPLGRMSFSLFIPGDMQASTKGKQFPALLESLPLAVLEGDGSFRQELTAIKLRVQIKVECSSFPLVARALASGTLAGILPSMAAEELRRLGMIEIPTKALHAFEREMCVAWNPRQLRIRTALEKTRGVLVEVLRF
jgi:DNA-binding transcriptional LysR family regulator